MIVAILLGPGFLTKQGNFLRSLLRTKYRDFEVVELREKAEIQSIDRDVLLVDVNYFYDFDVNYFVAAAAGNPAVALRYFPADDVVKEVGVEFIPLGSKQEKQQVLTGGLLLSASDDLQTMEKSYTTWKQKQRKPTLFLDRDGVIIEDVSYPHRPEDLILIEDTIKMMQDARAKGYYLISLSNQSGVARGMFDEKALEAFTDLMNNQLEKKQAKLDAIYYCPFFADAKIPAYKKDSWLRKPKPGLMLSALNDFPIDLSKSLMIGDKPSDVLEGMNITTWLISGRYPITIEHPYIFVTHHAMYERFKTH